MFGFLLCKALADATCWNAFFCCFNTQESSKKGSLFLKSLYVFVPLHQFTVLLCTVSLYRKCEGKNKAIGCWNCWIQRGTIFRMCHFGFSCDWEVKNTEPFVLIMAQVCTTPRLKPGFGVTESPTLVSHTAHNPNQSPPRVNNGPLKFYDLQSGFVALRSHLALYGHLYPFPPGQKWGGESRSCVSVTRWG